MTNNRKNAALFVAIMLAVPVAANADGDPVAGKTVANKCMVCHSFTAGENRIGPSLAGVVGRKSGTIPNYNYSPAMKNIGLTWTPDVLDKYLTSPKAVVPGTKMIFAGLPTPADRANVIAFLTQNGAAATGK